MYTKTISGSSYLGGKVTGDPLVVFDDVSRKVYRWFLKSGGITEVGSDFSSSLSMKFVTSLCKILI